jgi:hypothetical protein
MVLRLFFLGWPDGPVLTCIGYFFLGTAIYGAALRGWLRQPVLIGASLGCGWLVVHPRPSLSLRCHGAGGHVCGAVRDAGHRSGRQA